MKKRVAFDGNPANAEIWNKYIYKKLDYEFKKGSANPIRYINIKNISSHENDESEWDGVTKSYSISKKRNSELQNLFKNAIDNSWGTVIDKLKNNTKYINSVQPDTENEYTLLHYAAQSMNILAIKALIKLGAWRSVKSNSGEMPVNLIADIQENSEVIRLLTPKFRGRFDADQLQAIEKLYQQLIIELTEGLAGKHKLRLPQLQVLLELEKSSQWFPVPRMYGGFSSFLNYDLSNITLKVASWSRIVGESYKIHEIDKNNVVLIVSSKSS
jgi:hypothetical protein